MSRSRILPSLLAAASLTTACDIPNPGVPLQPGDLSFPTAIAVAPPQTPATPSRYVVVAGSNYDLRSDQAALMSLDLDAIAAAYAGCPDQTTECFVGNAEDFVAGQVFIDSFAAGVVFSPQGDRVYLPVRSSADLTWVDFDPATGSLTCGATDGFRCDDAHRTTLVEDGCPGRTVTLSGDPNGLVAGSMSDFSDDPAEADRDWVLMIQRNGTAALFLDRGDGPGRQPVLTHVLSGLPVDAINAALEPETNLTWINIASPITRTGQPQRILPLVGVGIDQQQRECSTAFFAGNVVLGGIATGIESRDVSWSHGGRFAHVLSRTPEGVITVDQDSPPLNFGEAPIVDVDAVGFGPSRSITTTLGGEEMVVATCYDARNITILRTDPVEIASVVAGFDGPYEVTVDPVRQWAIVADFKTSVVRIVDLSPLTTPDPDDEPTIIIRVGTQRTRLGFP